MTERLSDAEVFYGGTTAPTTALTPKGAPAAQANAPTEWNPGNIHDEQLFGTASGDYPAPKEMYPIEISARTSLRQHQNTLTDALGWGQQDRVAFNRQYVAALRESGLDASVVGEPLLEALVPTLVANHRGVEYDDAQAAQFDEDIRREQRELLGSPERAERLFEETRKFVAAHPKLQAVLSTPGIGMHPSARKAMGAIFEHVRKTNFI